MYLLEWNRYTGRIGYTTTRVFVIATNRVSTSFADDELHDPNAKVKVDNIKKF